MAEIFWQCWWQLGPLMNPTEFGSNHPMISPSPHTNSYRNCTYLHIIMVIMQQSWTDQFYVLRSHKVKFGENRIKFDSSHNIDVKFVENRIKFDSSPNRKSPLEIHVYAYKWLKNVGIVMKFGIDVYFVNLNHIAKFCYDQSIIAPRFKIGPLRKNV